MNENFMLGLGIGTIIGIVVGALAMRLSFPPSRVIRVVTKPREEKDV